MDREEVGYRELRMLWDYLWLPSYRTTTNTTTDTNNDESNDGDENGRPLLIDASDLLSHPTSILQSVCSYIGISYSPSMLSWPSAEDHAYAKSFFAKYAGYHEDALSSTGLKARREERPTEGAGGSKKKEEGGIRREEEDRVWVDEYGSEAANTIRDAVERCKGDYEYLRGFRIRFGDGQRVPSGGRGA